MLYFLIQFNSLCQTKETVIERYLKAIGGKENWLAIRTQIDSGMTIKFAEKTLFHNTTSDISYFKTILARPDPSLLMKSLVFLIQIERKLNSKFN